MSEEHQIPDTPDELIDKIDEAKAATDGGTEETRKHDILEVANHRHLFRRAVHEVTGHPKDQVYYGSAEEGATCECGAHWGPADMRV